MAYSGSPDTEASILIVDDQQQNLTLLEQGLNDLATIVCCQQARHAFAMAIRHAPALILLDIEMPDGNGLQLCKALKSSVRTRHIPIIFITAHQDIAIETQALSLGAIDFITRPIHLNVCRMRIFNHLKLQQQSRQLSALNHTLQHQREQLHIILQAMQDGVVAVDETQCVSFINPVAQQMTGYSAAEAAGKPLGAIVQLTDANTQGLLTNPVAAAMHSNCHQDLPAGVKLLHRNQPPMWVRCSASPTRDSQQRVSGAVLMLEDISRLHQQVHPYARLANHSSQTGLPNRLILCEHLHELVCHSTPAQQLAGILAIKIDKFAFVTDMLGQAQATEVICQLARRLEAQCNQHLQLYQVGNDEFVMVFTQMTDQQALDALARLLNQLMEHPVMVGDEIYSLSCSISISVFGKDAHSVPELLQHAQNAMQHAKAQGRNKLSAFEQMQNDSQASDQMNTQPAAGV